MRLPLASQVIYAAGSFLLPEYVRPLIQAQSCNLLEVSVPICCYHAAVKVLPINPGYPWRRYGSDTALSGSPCSPRPASSCPAVRIRADRNTWGPRAG